MQIMRYDFTAPAGKHFGIIQTMEQALAAIPGWVDRWTPAAENVTQAGGLITEWTGALGRKLTQATVSRQPALAGSEILFGNGAGALKAELSLSGAALGAITDLTVAGRFRLPAEAVAVDTHYLFGQQTGQIFRIARRYQATPRAYIRTEFPTAGAIVGEMDIPAADTIIPVVMVISGTTGFRMVSNDVSVAGTLPSQLTLTTFTLGGPNPAVADWPGWVGKFGILQHAATDAQIATLQAWLAA